MPIPKGLTPSRELLFFDPGPWSRAVSSTPVVSTAPPLYGPIALPFSLLRWRGLVALNTLAYLATIALVYLYARLYAVDTSTPWIAAIAFALGGYVIEYAQGVWPQVLSLSLCAGGVFAAGRLIDGGRISLSAASGFLLAVAAGIRYQNAVMLGAVGAGVALWAAPRRRTLPAFVLAAALPLAVSSAFNHLRFDSWNPISKGPGYLSPQMVQDRSTPLLDPLVALWARVVDASAQPRLSGREVEAWLVYEPRTGAHLLSGVTVKKSLLQSAPWCLLALVMFGLGWWPGATMRHPRRRQLRLLSIVTISLLGVMSLAGTLRHEGFAFNQRYLLELLPLMAVGFAWALDGLGLRLRSVATGAGIGVVLVLVILIGTTGSGEARDRLFLMRQLALMKVPLLLASLIGVVWCVNRWRGSHRQLLAAAAGVCLAWGLTVHLLDDLVASRRIRAANMHRTQALEGVLKDHTAYVAYWWLKDAAVPLLFDRDIVILDVNGDNGETAPVLIRELLAAGRRVYLNADNFPADILARVTAGLRATPVDHQRLRLLELR